MWSGVGLALCILQIGIACWRTASPTSNYYERDVYAMTRRTHMRYALVSALFAAFFIASFFVQLPAVPLLAVYALIFIFYLSSFARGFSDEE
jgi:hypothetical protein